MVRRLTLTDSVGVHDVTGFARVAGGGFTAVTVAVAARCQAHTTEQVLETDHNCNKTCNKTYDKI